MPNRSSLEFNFPERLTGAVDRPPRERGSRVPRSGPGFYRPEEEDADPEPEAEPEADAVPYRNAEPELLPGPQLLHTPLPRRKPGPSWWSGRPS